MDVGNKNIVGSSNIGSYNRYVLRSDFPITNIKYTGIYVIRHVLITGTECSYNRHRMFLYPAQIEWGRIQKIR